MHMGAMAVIGSKNPKNLIHVVINNCAHETVGGMPTVAENICFIQIAKACGYINAVLVENYNNLEEELEKAKTKDELTFIEVKAGLQSREDLGRPTTTAIENKESFMDYLKK